MERGAWTSERLDDLAQQVQTGFARVDADIRELRGELHDFRSEIRAELREEVGTVRGEVSAFREEMKHEIGSLRHDIGALRTAMFGMGGAILAAVIATSLVGGAA